MRERSEKARILEKVARRAIIPKGSVMTEETPPQDRPADADENEQTQEQKQQALSAQLDEQKTSKSYSELPPGGTCANIKRRNCTPSCP